MLCLACVLSTSTPGSAFGTIRPLHLLIDLRSIVWLGPMALRLYGYGPMALWHCFYLLFIWHYVDRLVSRLTEVALHHGYGPLRFIYFNLRLHWYRTQFYYMAMRIDWCGQRLIIYVLSYFNTALLCYMARPLWPCVYLTWLGRYGPACYWKWSSLYGPHFTEMARPFMALRFIVMARQFRYELAYRLYGSASI